MKSIWVYKDQTYYHIGVFPIGSILFFVLPTNHSQSGFHLTSHTLFPIVPHRSEPFATGRPATSSDILGSRGTFVEPFQTGDRCAMSTITLKAFCIRRTNSENWPPIRRASNFFETTGKLVEPLSPYQNDFRIILIFVAPIFDSHFSYQKYFLD